MPAIVVGIGIARVLSNQAVDVLTRGTVVQLVASHGRAENPVHLLYPGGAHPPPKLPSSTSRCRNCARGSSGQAFAP